MYETIICPKCQFEFKKWTNDISEKKYNASINKMCSRCGRYADIIIPNKIKLCSECFEKYISSECFEKYFS